MVKVYRYSRWDGSASPPDLDSDSIFDELLDRLMDQGDLSYALEQIMREGFQGQAKNFRLKGLNQLIDELRAWKQQRFDTFHLESFFDGIKRRLDRILQKELDTVRKTFSGKYHRASEGQGKDAALRRLFDEESRREIALTHLPKNLSDTLDHLSHYDFLNREAKKEFEELKRLLEDVKALEKFRNRFGHRFRGKKPLSFTEAPDLKKDFDALERLERALERGDLDGVNMEDLKKFLGIDALISFHTLQRLSKNLEEAGYIVRSGGRWQLSPEGVRKIGQRALKDIYSTLTKDHIGRHDTSFYGGGVIRPEETKNYEYGDPFHLDVVRTIKNAMTRASALRKKPGEFPLPIMSRDFEVTTMELSSRSSTALLLDMSWSMSWGNKFPAAKKVALALDHLIRTRFPSDNLYIVGFFTVAMEIKPHDLPTLDINLAEPFTNIQDGFRLAERLISRDRGANKQIILITDGQPTAYFLNGQLEVEWPVFGVSPTAFLETLKEVRRITKKGVRINTFMLDDSPSLKDFVREMTKINRGRAFFTRPDQLGSYLLVDFIQRKTSRLH